ncbi:class I SAM-dependent methyltransferase [Herbiconiux ginsengi]|uniref:Ubiquinone/menaquinone biosynthesis C-methylase UbiE n=1 Tax=Herbiconiux ginsengi TaxID=381665 RepID=A0A1H3LFY6_9MICO|nr:class I SAM-dependent methyltransferase [Herbiconiux ginsengi]SDY62878.1 Ubiquinone/menaquinone biosynthesis C-methylase UbiE [Herbiconiux ginsengi]
MSDTTETTSTPSGGSAAGFELHSGRGPFNAAFFRAVGPYLERSLRGQKRRVFAGLPREVVEIGPGVGANLRYLPRGGVLVAIEPNRYMHGRLQDSARGHGVRLDLRERMAESTGLPDHSVDTVISSLVLCSVGDPDVVLAEIRRILRPGGTFRFVEHVAAAAGTPTRLAQRLLRRPWAWTFEGCSCERDLEGAIRSAGFGRVAIERYRVHTPFLPFNTQIAGVARV